MFALFITISPGLASQHIRVNFSISNRVMSASHIDRKAIKDHRTFLCRDVVNPMWSDMRYKIIIYYTIWHDVLRSGAIITRSAKTWYFKQHCNVLCTKPIRVCTHQEHRTTARYCEDFRGQYNGTTPYMIYRKIFNIRRAKTPNLNVSCLVLQLSLPNPMKPAVKSRMKM